MGGSLAASVLPRQLWGRLTCVCAPFCFFRCCLFVFVVLFCFAVTVAVADGWKLRPDVLDAACKEDPSKPRTLVLNSPSNPTGAVHSEQELKEIAEVCERYGILVISDEIYGKLTFDGQYHSISRFYPEVRVHATANKQHIGVLGGSVCAGVWVGGVLLSWLQQRPFVSVA